MRGHWSHRLAAILFAVWFGLVGLEPGALGACPEHSLATAGASASMHGSHADAMAGAMAHDQGSAQSPAAPAHSDHHGTHHCSCPGSCCAVAVLALPTVAAHEYLVTNVTTARPAPRVEIRDASFDFVLPFATAPPSARSV